MIESRSVGDTRVILLSGRLDSVSAPAAESAIIAEIEAGATRLALDCSGVAYVSSAGLRVFLVVAKRIKALGGRLALASLRPEVREVFAISGFLQILTTFETVDDAVAACSD